MLLLRGYAGEVRCGDLAIHQAGDRELFPLYHPAAALHGGKLRAVLIEDARALGRWLSAA